MKNAISSSLHGKGSMQGGSAGVVKGDIKAKASMARISLGVGM